VKDTLISSLRSVAEESVPASVKDRIREALAKRLAGHVVSYRDLRRRNEVGCWKFSADRTFEFTEPTFSNHTPEEISRLIGSHTIHRPYVLEVPDVTLVGNQGMKRTPDGSFIVYDFDRPATEQAQLELAYDIVDGLSMGTVPLGRGTGDIEQVGLAVPLINRWARNYSHWTEECLAQIEGIRHYETETGERPTLLIPADSPSFVGESLEYFGFDSTDYREMTAERVQVDRLVLPSIRRFWSSTSTDYVRDPYAIQWIREQVFEGLPAFDVDEYPSKILISREQDARERRMTNWGAVESALADRGFETVVLTELDFVEQKKLFHGAETIVGAHGAGMTELIYASDTAVVELFGSYVVPPYYEMAQAVGHRYCFLQCESRGHDIYVDVPTLCDAIDRVRTV
jgi:hypothetical protein